MTVAEQLGGAEAVDSALAHRPRPSGQAHGLPAGVDHGRRVHAQHELHRRRACRRARGALEAQSTATPAGWEAAAARFVAIVEAVKRPPSARGRLGWRRRRQRRRRRQWRQRRQRRWRWWRRQGRQWQRRGRRRADRRRQRRRGRRGQRQRGARAARRWRWRPPLRATVRPPTRSWAPWPATRSCLRRGRAAKLDDPLKEAARIVTRAWQVGMGLLVLQRQG